MPDPNTFISFKNYKKELKLPFVVYADFECFTIPVHNCDPNPENSFTVEYQKHIPCGFCLYVKPLDGCKDEVIKDNLFIYTKRSNDENIAEIFVKKLKKIKREKQAHSFRRIKKLGVRCTLRIE